MNESIPNSPAQNKGNEMPVDMHMPPESQNASIREQEEVELPRSKPSPEAALAILRKKIQEEGKNGNNQTNVPDVSNTKWAKNDSEVDDPQERVRRDYSELGEINNNWKNIKEKRPSFWDKAIHPVEQIGGWLKHIVDQREVAQKIEKDTHDVKIKRDRKNLH